MTPTLYKYIRNVLPLHDIVTQNVCTSPYHSQHIVRLLKILSELLRDIMADSSDHATIAVFIKTSMTYIQLIAFTGNKRILFVVQSRILLRILLLHSTALRHRRKQPHAMHAIAL